MFHWIIERRRRHLLEQPFPGEWAAILERNVAVLGRLEPALHPRLRDLTQVLIDEKNWEGCGGLELTDEHRVTIAAQASMLLVGINNHDLFAEAVSILVYPSTMVAPRRPHGVFEIPPTAPEVASPLLGQAFKKGAVIIAWDRALAGARDADGQDNVVFHEFAHEIDMHDGPIDGTPPLADERRRRAWVAACEPAFLALRAAVERGEDTFLGDYAATNEAEFFAVATEAYFVRPRALATAMPALFAVLREFYQVELVPRASDV
ncbi:MAG: zinc-dependent peptidase [Deltaproteobacteria bacterium]|nr:zinc-dependent peptidase [Deltaproteobacteria bacterium]